MCLHVHNSHDESGHAWSNGQRVLGQDHLCLLQRRGCPQGHARASVDV